MNEKKAKLPKKVILGGIVFLLYLLIPSILDLTNEKDKQEITIDAAYEIIELEDTFYGLIPLGTTYYYVGITEDTMQAYIFTEKKNYLDGKFDADGYAISNTGVTVKGLVKKESEYEVEVELANYISQIGEMNFPNGASYIINTNYVTKAIIKLVTCASWIIFTLGAIIIPKQQNQQNISTIRGKITNVALILVLILSLICVIP